MKIGRYTDAGQRIKQLEKVIIEKNAIISRKDREIHNVKCSIADVLLQIRNFNESNTYSDPSLRRRKISEMCTDARYQLLVDEIDDFYKKESAKIIELPNTRKSNK